MSVYKIFSRMNPMDVSNPPVFKIKHQLTQCTFKSLTPQLCRRPFVSKHAKKNNFCLKNCDLYVVTRNFSRFKFVLFSTSGESYGVWFRSRNVTHITKTLLEQIRKSASGKNMKRKSNKCC